YVSSAGAKFIMVETHKPVLHTHTHPPTHTHTHTHTHTYTTKHTHTRTHTHAHTHTHPQTLALVQCSGDQRSVPRWQSAAQQTLLQTALSGPARSWTWEPGRETATPYRSGLSP